MQRTSTPSTPSLAYQTHGDPSNPAIMLLHGFMSSNAQWLLNTQALADGYFLVTVELWGHGDCATPDDPAVYTIDAYIRQFEQIRQQLGMDHWHVIGQSYGAGLVINYAITRPQQIGKVVATNSRSAFAALSSDHARGRDGARPRQGQGDLRKLPYHPIHARRFPAQVKQALVDKADAMEPEAVALGGSLGAKLNCTQRLDELHRPLLITNGKYEKSFQEDLRSLQASYPKLNVVHLDGGHSVNIEAAEQFNRAVLEFLA